MPVETLSLQTRSSAQNVWAEIDLGAIQRNLERLRAQTRPFTRVMAVVKSNAYGHGLVPVAQALGEKVDFLGIGSLKEASLLREQGIPTPLFLFGRLFEEEIPLALQMRLTLTISSVEEARAISEVASDFPKRKRPHAHVKVDTGMSRFGIPYETAFSEIEKIAELPHLKLEGIYTHFPQAERFPEPLTEDALRRFEKLIQDLRREGISFTYRHAANSAGAIRIKSPHLNLVRPGLALYGIYPHPSLTGEIDLEPALCLKTRVAFVKRIRAGDSVGYGREFVARRPTTIAVLPVGYAQGYPFALSGRAEILYRGKRFPMAGRVCMDSMMIDLGEEEARIGDEIILLGPSGEERIQAEELASLGKTIPYEIVTRLEASLPRIYRPRQGVRS